MATATAPSTTATLPAGVRGGAYAATQNADGTWNVLDVPTFAAHQRSGLTIDRAWLESAVKRAGELQTGEYAPPLHVGHHSDGAAKRAGYFMPRRVESRQFGGSAAPLPVLMSDLLSVPDSAYQEIKAGRLPYVSVEVADLRKPEITSLALLADDAPWFKFPLLTIGEEQSAVPLAASAGARFLYHDGLGPRGARYMASEALDLKGKIVKAFTTALDSAFGTEAPSNPLGPAELPAAAPPPPAAPISARAADKPITYADLARIEGRLEAFDLAQKKAGDAQKLDGVVHAAVRTLATYGILGDEVEARVRKYATSGGEVAVTTYVDTVKAYAAPRPPEAWLGELPGSSHAEAPAAAAYAGRGEPVQREASRLSAVYAAMPASLRHGFSLADFLKKELGPATSTGTGRN